VYCLGNYRLLARWRIELSKNRAERSIKAFVHSRKNFLFANIPDGARCSAILFSLIETAKAKGLDLCHHLTWVLPEPPKRNAVGSDLPDESAPQRAPQESGAISNT
jgi:hypothetical protein